MTASSVISASVTRQTPTSTRWSTWVDVAPGCRQVGALRAERRDKRDDHPRRETADEAAAPVWTVQTMPQVAFRPPATTPRPSSPDWCVAVGTGCVSAWVTVWRHVSQVEPKHLYSRLPKWDLGQGLSAAPAAPSCFSLFLAHDHARRYLLAVGYHLPFTALQSADNHTAVIPIPPG